jgi:hypothetical protein
MTNPPWPEAKGKKLPVQLVQYVIENRKGKR